MAASPFHLGRACRRPLWLTSSGNQNSLQRPCPKAATFRYFGVSPFRAHATFASAGAVRDEALIPAVRTRHRAMGHPPPPSPRSRGWRAFSKPMSCERLPNVVSGRETAVQRVNMPVLLPVTASDNRRSGELKAAAINGI